LNAARIRCPPSWPGRLARVSCVSVILISYIHHYPRYSGARNSYHLRVCAVLKSGVVINNAARGKMTAHHRPHALTVYDNQSVALPRHHTGLYTTQLFDWDYCTCEHHVSSQEILPTSGRTAYDSTHPSNTLRHKESFLVRIGGQRDGNPQELTVDPVDDHDWSGAETFESWDREAKSIRLHLLYFLLL
jgi:hypothetical protein